MPSLMKKGIPLTARLLFFSFGLLIACQNKPTHSSQELYNQYYQPFEEFSSFKSKDTLLENQLNKALESYLEKNYHGAFEQFSFILSQGNENQITATFYTALSLLEMKHSTPDQNILLQNLLTDLFEQGRNPFAEDAKWYLALHHLKIGQRKDAITSFERLVSLKGKYEVKAKEILEIIEEK